MNKFYKILKLPTCFVLCIIIALAGCSLKSIKPVTLTIDSSGPSEKEALDSAFREAAMKATGTYIYNTETFSNGKFIEDKTATYTNAFIKNYTILERFDSDNFVKLKVKVDLNVKNPENFSEVTNNSTSKTMLQTLESINNSQGKAIKSQKLMEVFIDDYTQFFDRAYKVKVVGYETTKIETEAIKGFYLVELSLNTEFWDQYNNILAANEISKSKYLDGDGIFNGKTLKKFPKQLQILVLIPAIPVYILQGLYRDVFLQEKYEESFEEFMGLEEGKERGFTSINRREHKRDFSYNDFSTIGVEEGMLSVSCPQSFGKTYNVPQDVRFSLPSVEISYKRPFTGIHKINLIKNSIMFNSTVMEEYSGVYSEITTKMLVKNYGIGSGVKNCDRHYKDIRYVPFEKEIIIKLPFLVKDTDTIGEVVENNKIPWAITVNKPLNHLIKKPKW